MTLVVALKSRDAIVVAADSRATVGDPRSLTAVNDTQTKIYPVGKCAIAFAGASELGQTLLDGLRRDAYSEIEAAVQRVSRDFETSFREWFKGYAPEQRPGVLITLAGYRTRKGADPEPMIYMLNSQVGFAPQLFGTNPCMMGVPQYAVYVAHRYYDPSITTEKARALAEYLIASSRSARA